MAINGKLAISCLIVGFGTACASLSNKDASETARSEADIEAVESVPEEAAPRVFAAGSEAAKELEEVKLLDVERQPAKMRPSKAAAKRKMAPSKPSQDASKQGGIDSAPATAPKAMMTSRGTESECDEVLGGDYWAERIRIEPSFRRFFQAQSRQPFELSVYRRISSSPEEFTRVFQMEEAALRVSFVVETPTERIEESDFIYEVQLLNRASEPAEYCLKHWR